MDDEDDVFSGTLANAHVISTLLKSVCVNQIVKVSGSDLGLKLSVEESRTSQIIQYMPAGLFETFNIRRDEEEGARENLDEDEHFAFNMNAKSLMLIATSATKAGSTSLQMRYPGFGEAWHFALSDGNMNHDIRLKTLAPTASQAMVTDADEADETNSVMLRADYLREVTHEMEKSVDRGGDDIEIVVTIKKQRKSLTFTLTGGSDFHEFFLDSNSKCMELMKCEPPEVQEKYNYGLFRNCYNTMSIAHRVKLQILPKTGILFLQFLVKLDKNATGKSDQEVFIDFYLMPSLASE